MPQSAAPAGGWLAGISPDGIESADRLSFADEVNTLASVLASWQSEEPLAIGVFGQWGSGKSFFMRQMQARIAALSDASAKAAEQSLYCPYIKQVHFNAWLHADSDIWRSLAARVLRAVAGEASDAVSGSAQSQELREYQDRLQLASAPAGDARAPSPEVEIRAIDEKLAALKAKGEREASDASPALRLAVETSHTAALAKVTWGELRAEWQAMRKSPRRGLIGLVVLAAVAAVYSLLTRSPGWLSVVVASALLVLAQSRKVLGQVRDLLADRRQVRALLERRNALARTAGSEPDGVQGLRELFLPEHASERAAYWMANREVGVVGQIREEFAALSAVITRSRTLRATVPQSGTDLKAPPIDRVIVYIDDLDRCPPAIVFRVLESIKLLMDLRHFVVVVGVDSRWLFRALQLELARMLGSDGTGGWAPTPENYLDKIFQLSFVVPSMTGEGFGRLVESLLQVDAQTDVAVQGPGPGQAQLDLNPRTLLITDAEVAFTKALARLIPTPRAAKRLTNVYRLIRASLDEDELTHFVSSGHQPLLLLLAVFIGHTVEATAFGESLWSKAESDPRTEWEQFLNGTVSRTSGWDTLAKELRRVQDQTGVQAAIGDFSPWLPVVAGHVFHPWRTYAT